MGANKVFWAISGTALVLMLILICLKAYYVVVALVVGTLIIGHRELWSLAREKRLPPVDERVRDNAAKSVRNAFIFFAISSAFLMIFFTLNRSATLDTVHVIGGLFVSVGVVYLFSYLFYDRAQPKLTERGLKMLKTFLLVAGISAGALVISIVLHNLISGLLSMEEPVFFFIAVLVAPLGLVVGVVGSAVLFFRGLTSRGA